MNKAEAKKILSESVTDIVEVNRGELIQVFVGSTEDSVGVLVDEFKAVQLKKGNAIEHKGVQQWIINEPIVFYEKDVETYIWDKSYNRVKNNRVLYTKVGKSLTKKVIGTSFRNF